MQIIPAILTSDINKVEEQIKATEGLVDRVQIDILDGVFADNKTITLEALAELEIRIKFDIHLMVKEPMGWIEKSFRAGADRVIGQIEMMENQSEFVNKVIENNMLAGLAIDLGTPISEIDETILPELDTVLIMAVKAGFQNQEFEEYALDKVKELEEKRKLENLNFKICVDGGVEANNIKKIAQAGANEVVAGSSLFEGNLSENLERFKGEL